MTANISNLKDKFYQGFSPVLLIFFILSAPAFGNDATLSGTSFSIELGDAETDIGANYLFTTYDGDRYGWPYFYDDPNDTLYWSSELKRVGSMYKTDYFGIVYENEVATIDDYGEVTLDLGSIDSDGNGIDDICEKQKSVNASVSGNWYSFDGASGSISGTMARDANSQQGSYNLTVTNTDAGTITAWGDFYTGVLSGTVTYNDIDHTIEANFSSTFEDASSPQTIATTYEVLDKDRIRIHAKDFLPDTVFARSGNTYAAVVELTDGGSGTFWPDYQKWNIQIEDSNDSDADGIPDFSDENDNSVPGHLSALWLLLFP